MQKRSISTLKFPFRNKRLFFFFFLNPSKTSESSSFHKKLNQLHFWFFNSTRQENNFQGPLSQKNLTEELVTNINIKIFPVHPYSSLPSCSLKYSYLSTTIVLNFVSHNENVLLVSGPLYTRKIY